MKVRIDYNLEGQARLSFNRLRKDGWAELFDLEFVYFSSTGALTPDSDDITIWRYAQAHGCIILTNNRNRKDETSLTATIERENTLASLPVVTIVDADRLAEPAYRAATGIGLVNILMYLDNYRGTGRVFIP